MKVSRRHFMGTAGAFALAGGLFPSAAQAVSLMDPFNLPTAVD
ncbi:MAG TPA: hypothetical protein DIT93_11605, partial [Pelagibacterium sp.]|nr:hypothetical protein [Pelagibacterium sp.]